MSLKIKLTVFLLFFIFKNLSAQFTIQVNSGIENPYKYTYNTNITPSIPDDNYAWQKFRFFRTKILSTGIVYNKTLPIFNERIDLTGGTSVGFMDQFVADTVANPERDKLLYNAVHRNVFLAPEIGIRFRIYKSLYFTGGIEMFFPMYKWISSEQESKKFDQSISPKFYNEAIYSSIGLDYDFDKITVGLKFQNSGEADHWIDPFIKGLFFSHKLQRWMLSFRYKI